MTGETKQRPRGGIILSVTPVGVRRQYLEVWCIDPQTLEERVITIWAQPHLTPQSGDECWWNRNHSPGWKRKGETVRTAFLPRVGRSFDPMKR